MSTSFEFHRALRFEQEFDIHIRVTAITRKSIQYRCELTDADTRIATGTLTIVCVRHKPNEPMVSAEIPDDIRSRFQVSPGTQA